MSVHWLATSPTLVAIRNLVDLVVYPSLLVYFWRRRSA